MQVSQQFSIFFRFTINQQVACFHNLWKARQCFSTCTDLTKNLLLLRNLLTVKVCLLWFLSGKNYKIYFCSFYNNALLLIRSAELSHQLWTCCLSFGSANLSKRIFAPKSETCPGLAEYYDFNATRRHWLLTFIFLLFFVS